LPTPEIQQLRKIWWRSAVAGAGCNCFGYPCTISVPVPATTKSAKRFFSCVNFFFYDRLTLKTVATVILYLRYDDWKYLPNENHRPNADKMGKAAIAGNYFA
jgi:hypothetical protein